MPKSRKSSKKTQPTKKKASRKQVKLPTDAGLQDPLGPDVRPQAGEKPSPDDPGEYALMRAFAQKRPFAELIKANQSSTRRPATIDPHVEPGPEQIRKFANKYGALIGESKAAKLEVVRTENPVPESSFGFVGGSVKVSGSAKTPFRATLVLTFNRKKLEDIARDTLRLFRFDEKAKRFVKVPGSRTSGYGDYVFGRISKPGIYTAVGLRSDPRILQTLRTIDGIGPMRSLFGDIGTFRERLCLLILCAGDLRERFDNPEIMQRMMHENGMAGINYPVENYPPPQEARGYDDICEFCLGRSGLHLPELDILDEYPVPGTSPGCSEGPWESVGPADLAGCIKHVAVDPSNSDRIYCAAAHGGIWRLDDVSRYPYVSWRPLSDQQDLLKTVAIAVAPSDPDRLYYADGTGKVYRSDDRGLNWIAPSPQVHHTSPTIFQPLRILVHKSAPDVILVSGTAGLRLSIDGGVSWITRTTQTIEDIAFDPQDSSILYIAVRGLGVFKSFAMGADRASWMELLPWSAASSPVNSSIRLGVGHRNGDGTLQSDANRTLVAKLGNEIFVNQAGGASGGWQSKGTIGSHGYGDWCNSLAVDPFNSDIILAGQMELFRSDDGGDNWSNVASYYRPHEDQQYIAFDPNRQGTVFLANDGGVFRSSDGGVTWFVEGETAADAIGAGRNLNKNLVTAELYRVGVQGNRAVANLFHSGIIASNDVRTSRWRGIEGHAWEFNNIYADPVRLGRYYVFTNTNLAIRRYPGVAGSDNFVPYSPLGSDTAPPYLTGSGTSLAVGAIAIDTRAGSNIILYGALPGSDSTHHRLMKTDHGDRYPIKQPDDSFTNMPEWRSVIDNGADPIVAVSFEPSPTSRVYAMSRSGGLFINDDVADDSGWSAHEVWTNGVRHMAVGAGPDPTVYAVNGSQVGRRRTGQSWSTVGAGTLPTSEINSIAASPNDPLRLFIGADEGVFQSVDEGDSWTPFDTDLPNAEVLQIFIHNGALWAVTHGRGLWRYDLC